jgi:hypothetical protein
LIGGCWFFSPCYAVQRDLEGRSVRV